MKKWLPFLLLWPTVVLAAAGDNYIINKNNNKSIQIITTTSGGTQTSAGSIDGSQKWIIGQTGSTEAHVINGSSTTLKGTTGATIINIDPPSGSSAVLRYSRASATKWELYNTTADEFRFDFNGSTLGKFLTTGEFKTNQALLSGTTAIKGATSGASMAGVSGNTWRGTRTGRIVTVTGAGAFTGAGSATGTICMVYEGAPDADVTVAPVCSVQSDSITWPSTSGFVVGQMGQSFGGDGNPYGCLQHMQSNVTTAGVISTAQADAGSFYMTCTYISASGEF